MTFTCELLLQNVSYPLLSHVVFSKSLEQGFEGGEAVLGRCALEPARQQLSEASDGIPRQDRGLYLVQYRVLEL